MLVPNRVASASNLPRAWETVTLKGDSAQTCSFALDSSSDLPDLYINASCGVRCISQYPMVVTWL